MAGYKLFCFGNPGLELDDQPIKLEMRKSLALLVYLCINHQDCSRETLAALLWPEYDQHHAQANLRRALSSLNNSLQVNLLTADRGTIGLKDPSQIWIDIEEFQACLKINNTHPHAQNQTCPECRDALEKALKLYRGDFMEGFNLKECTAFDEWQYLQRESLRQQLGQTLQKISETYASQLLWEQSIAHAQHWVGLDRLDEPAQRHLINLYARSGQRNAALRQYEELKRLLNDQLGQSPEQETLQLYEQLRGMEEPQKKIEPPERISLFPILKTKLFIPAPPASRVKRIDLVQRLFNVEQKALTIISAPAGYGKTTLLSEWLTQTSVPVAWLSLDKGDNDPYRLLTYIIASLDNIDEDVGLEARQILESSRTVPPHIILASLINNLITLVEPYVLVLDDYQFITETVAHEVIAYILDHLPVNMHLVIATRSDPPLQLGRLRAYDQLLEIRTQHLRFNGDEASEFLNIVMKLGLLEEDISSLELRTEGWVAGLKMAALSLQGRVGASEFIRAFSGSQRYVLEYLMEEVMKLQPIHVQKFLLETSILDSMSGPLCDAVLANEEESYEEGDDLLVRPESPFFHQSASILEYLDRANLFLVPLDDERIWYRYHHLFADLLLQRLKQTQSEKVNKLYLRAATWLEKNDYLENAIEYALKAKDYVLATRLMDRIKINLWSHGEVRMLQYWLNTMPEELIRTQPEVSLDYAACLTLAGYFDAAEKWLKLAEEGFSPSTTSDRQATLRATVMIPLYRSASARFHGDFPTAIALGESALNLTPSTEVRYKGVSYLFLGQAHFYAGNTNAADQILSDAIPNNLASGHNAAYLGSCHDLAQLRVLQGRLREAKAIYEQAQLSIKERGITIYAGTEYSGLGDLKREWNELEAAAVEIQKGIDMAEISDHVFFLLDVYLARVRLALAHKDWEAAWSYLQKAEKVVQRCPTSIEIESIRTWQARVHLAQGNLAEAELWAGTKGMENTGSFSPQKEFELLTLARVRLAQGKTDQAGSLLGRIRIAAENAGRHGRSLEAQMLQALVHQAAGNENQAGEELSRVLVQAEPEGYVRLFLDEGVPMQKLLAKYQAHSSAGLLPDYAIHLLSQFNTETQI